MSDAARRIEAALGPIVDDPEAFHRQVLADIAKEKGQDWVDEHLAELDANWEAAKFLFGL